MMINEEIRDKEVRLIDSDGSQLGIVAVKEAQKMAYAKNLDLVKIAPKAEPPVCRIMDYGKHKFETAKKEKEVRLSPSIDSHDFNTKLNHAIKFLKNGDKVKVSVRFRGRELHHAALGEDILKRFAEGVSEVGNVDKQPKLEGRFMNMFVTPK